MAVTEWLAKVYPQWFSNPLAFILPIVVLVGIGLYFVMKEMNKVKMELFYFSPVERLIDPLKITDVSPRAVTTKDKKRFMRRAPSWLFKRGSNSIVVWLGKVGKGITFKIGATPEDQAEKVGTLLEGCESCLTDEETKKIPQAVRNKLSESNIFVCVELEDDFKGMPKITEEGATTEADNNVMNLIGMRIKEQLQKEDWIRDVGLVGIGVALLFIAQNLGVI